VEPGPALRRHAPLALVLIVVAVLCVLTHRNGIGWGDDFALYTRQARSLFDGDIARVITDNRFNVDNAARPGFSPYVYPWGWPLLLSPFVRLFGLDFNRLELVSVACFVGFLACFHALMTRRMGRWTALAVTAALGTSLPYVLHTGNVLSELPFMFAVAATLCWLDHCRPVGRPLAAATTRQLVVLGLLAMYVFDIRREGLAMVPAIAAVQLAECLPRHRWRRREWPWRRLVIPHATFAASVVAFQLVLPSALAPAYAGSGLGQTWRKLRHSFRDSFVDQLGFPRMGTYWLTVVLLVVLVGIAVRLRAHLADDVALLVFPIIALVIVGMIPADSTRYTLAITPFAVYFLAQALRAPPRPTGPVLAVVAAATLTVVHLTDVGPAVSDARDFADTGAISAGPQTAESQALWQAIRDHTHEDDVVAFFKVRALTLYTDRRGVQSSELPVIVARADYFATPRSPDRGVGQIGVSDADATGLGWTLVWSDDTWLLWKVPRS
jgi:hypothetical protein